MKEEFKILDEEELKKEYAREKKDFEIRKLMADFVETISKKGQKPVTKRIEKELADFLTERKIEYNNINFYNFDYARVYGKSYDRELIVEFPNYYGKQNKIYIKEGFNDNFYGGFYNNLLECNPWLSKEKIKIQEEEMEQNFENAFLSINRYNQKLTELIRLRDSFGYLAK